MNSIAAAIARATADTAAGTRDCCGGSTGKGRKGSLVADR